MFLISAMTSGGSIEDALAQAQAAHQQRRKSGCHTSFPKFLLSLAETREQQQRLPEQEQQRQLLLPSGCDRTDTSDTSDAITTISVDYKIVKDRNPLD